MVISTINLISIIQTKNNKQTILLETKGDPYLYGETKNKTSVTIGIPKAGEVAQTQAQRHRTDNSLCQW
jgi:hypothetical protein